MMNIVCASCKQRSQVTEAEYEACGHNWTCICKKPIPEGMSIRNCGRGLHTSTYQPKWTMMYDCKACQADIDASRSIKTIYTNPEDSPTYQRQKQREMYADIPIPKIKTFNEVQIELLQEISKKLDRILPQIEPHELETK